MVGRECTQMIHVRDEIHELHTYIYTHTFTHRYKLGVLLVHSNLDNRNKMSDSDLYSSLNILHSTGHSPSWSKFVPD